MRGRARLIAALALASLAPVVSATPAQILLVRHAEKAEAPKGDPGLSPQGQQRAQALDAALRETRIDAVLTTPFQRTRETAAPLRVRRLLLEIVVPVEGDHISAMLTRLQDLPDHGTALVVGHSNTLAPIIRGLGGPELSDLRECEFDRLYVLDTTPPVRLIQARYGASNPSC